MYGQVTQLFNTAPDLLEDFKQFLPESAAQAKAQAAAARQAMEDVTAISNVRGEPGYSNNALAQNQTPRSDVKMPPLGQFSVKDSAKDGKKRRGPGAQGTGAGVSGQSAGTDSMGAGGAQARAAGLQPGGLHKVSQVIKIFCGGWSTPMSLFSVTLGLFNDLLFPYTNPLNIVPNIYPSPFSHNLSFISYTFTSKIVFFSNQLSISHLPIPELAGQVSFYTAYCIISVPFYPLRLNILILQHGSQACSFPKTPC